jgi:regulator of sigma E protease
MSWVLAFLGFAALILLHELGHFTAAKAVGMRVERFAVFFPPLLAKKKVGETEYGIGAIPLGGYVRITGMNPDEEIPEDVLPRAYYKQPVWKRIVVISAGPAANVLVAFLIFWVLFLVNGKPVETLDVDKVTKGFPAAATLQAGDRIVSIDGVTGSQAALAKQTATHRCPGRQSDRCQARTPAVVVVQRDGVRRTFRITPIYDAKVKRTRLGFAFASGSESVGPVQAAGLSVTAMWRITTGTISAIVRIVTPEGRKQISGVVGSYEATRQSFEFDLTQALNILAIISLSLAIVNLFPFLPLDGGHIFWALAEKVRGRPIPFAVMERAGIVGFVLVLFLFFIGLTNDIDRLRGEGFGIR